jgi:hypothetical protein
MQFEKLAYLIPGLGMMLVGVVAVLYWYRRSGAKARWFWVGVGLWTISVALKLACAVLTNGPIIGPLRRFLPFPAYVACGGLYVGIQSSVFEMGFTIAAGLIWKQLGKDSSRAIAVGVGAGAFEAFLLGLLGLAAMVPIITGAPGSEELAKALSAQQAVTPLFWFVGPVERVTAVLVHASTRALVLLGLTYRKRMLVFWGFWIFALLDSVAGAAQLSESIGTISLWWIELALSPFALISIPILTWCVAHFPAKATEPEELATGLGEAGASPSDIAGRAKP